MRLPSSISQRLERPPSGTKFLASPSPQQSRTVRNSTIDTIHENPRILGTEKKTALGEIFNNQRYPLWRQERNRRYEQALKRPKHLLTCNHLPQAWKMFVIDFTSLSLFLFLSSKNIPWRRSITPTMFSLLYSGRDRGLERGRNEFLQHFSTHT